MKKRAAVIVSLLLVAALLLPAAGALADKTVLFTFTGDCTLGSEPSKYKLTNSFHSFAINYGYDYFFSDFREMFSNDDLTVINFEGVFTDEILRETKKTYCFRGPTDFVKIMTGSSVEAACLANNHTDDFGPAGAESTRKTLEENGIIWFANDDYAVWEHDGLKIAIFGAQSAKIKGKQGPYVKKVRELKESGAVDAIIFCVHIGLEYSSYRNAYAEEIAADVTAAGADLVIMHHPHVLQGIDILNGRTVFYSLGNFVFGGNSSVRSQYDPHRIWVTARYTVAVQAKLTFTDSGKYLGQQITVYPAYTSVDPVINFFRPVRVNTEQAEAIRDTIQRDTKFELPPVTQDGDFSKIVFEYLPGTDKPMLVEDDDEDLSTYVQPADRLPDSIMTPAP